MKVVVQGPPEIAAAELAFMSLAAVGGCPKFHRVNIQGYIRSVGTKEGTLERPQLKVEVADTSSRSVVVSCWGTQAASPLWQMWNMVEIVSASANPGWRCVEVDETSSVELC